MKILAVDDDHSIQQLLPMILHESGHDDVTVAGSADEALDTIRRSKVGFDCFLLDIQMPGRSGVELCADIRKIDAYRNVPIVMLTAMHERDFIEDAFHAGADDYLTKPFNIAEVGLRVRQAELQSQHQPISDVRSASTSTTLSSDVTSLSSEGALDLTAAKGVLNRQAFANYLKQLSRSGLQTTSFRATKVTNFEKLRASLSDPDFFYAMSHAADAIVEVLSPTGGLNMYSGAGVFISSSYATPVKTTIDIETEIQGILDERDLQSELDDPIDIEIAVGASAAPLLGADLKLEDLEAMVTDRANVRMKQIQETPRTVGNRPVVR